MIQKVDLSHIKHVVADIDGTIRNEDGKKDVPAIVPLGWSSFRESKLLAGSEVGFSVLTARSLPLIHSGLGSSFFTFYPASEKKLYIGANEGVTILDQHGKKIVHHILDGLTLDCIQEIICKGIYRPVSVVYTPADFQRQIRAWMPDENSEQQLYLKSHYELSFGHVKTATDFTEFVNQMKADGAGKVSFVARNKTDIEDLVRLYPKIFSLLNYSLTDRLSFKPIVEGVHIGKGSCLLALADLLGLELEEMMFIGNDENDLSAFNAGNQTHLRVFVGNKNDVFAKIKNQENNPVIRVDSPRELGKFFVLI